MRKPRRSRVSVAGPGAPALWLEALLAQANSLQVLSHTAFQLNGEQLFRLYCELHG